MNIKQDEYEKQVLLAFRAGLTAGYGIDHENIHEEEESAVRAYADSCGFQRASIAD